MKFLLTVLLMLFVISGVSAQRVAVIPIDKRSSGDPYINAFTEAVEKRFTLVDSDAAAAAFGSFKFASAANLTGEEAAAAGSAMGCDLFILIGGETIRRSSFEKEEYYEAYAPVFVVSSHTGRLAAWRLALVESAAADDAEKKLISSAAKTVSEIEPIIQQTRRTELDEKPPPRIEELPLKPEKGFQAPIPFRRIKPLYTDLAEHFAIAATVEITVDLDAAGAVTRTEITRWAGFGLDESVEKAVRSMNWRPAYRGPTPLPMRVLLRYNFKKL